jgi:O-antigen/teichoic acid export membrane protein
MSPRLFHDSLAVAASSYLARAVLIVRGLVAAAALGPHGYGGWNALNLIFEYGYYASLGTLQGLDRELPGAVAAGDRARASRLMAGAWAVTIAGAILYGALVGIDLLLGGRAIAAWVDPKLPLLALIGAWLQLGVHYLSSSLRAYGRFRALSAGGAIQAVIGGGLGIALVWRQGIFGMLWGWDLGAALAVLWMWRAVPEAPVLPAGWRTGWTLQRAGVPIFLYFALTTALRSMDRLALLHFGGEEPLGLYGIGLMAAGMVLYLPEAAGFVLFPRVAAGHQGSADPALARDAAVRAQRALNAFLPLLVGLGMVWAGPVLIALLPDFRGGLGALRVLAVGAAIYGAGTVPGYFLLATGRFRTLLGRGALATLVSGGLIVVVASRRPEPLPVALAAAFGYAVFALSVVHAAAGAWFTGAAARARTLASAIVPALWIGTAWLLVSRFGSDASWSAAIVRSLALALVYLPVLLTLARGIGLGRLAREAFARRGQ